MLVTIGFVPNRGNTFSSPMTIFCEVFLVLVLFFIPSYILFSFQISTPLDSVLFLFFFLFLKFLCKIPWAATYSEMQYLNKRDQNCLFITGKRTDMVGGFVSIPSAYSPAGETNKQKNRSTTSVLSQSLLSSGFPRIASCCHWLANCWGGKGGLCQ